ncbi:MAG: hypothetical protein COV41_02475 [Candidatus Brennerbacteria bacterium CG11_big_fil_rev_8_21_14_0_20_43_10]|uniref:Uncharacterized protein n=1 Tax=Candidatus Brennerbacteria bacterium CG11_big_fil_rev_8_21_14_0_20_43_10 TaxID=1974523 RepID=A0A2H0PWN8_9BACT|nr:MAG: hypothetical protein COV41_02475 [Candidatus Brennerbacteria bacterium CG11_big_fil_rev_8_21_14_0_20_43_10]
MLLAQVMAQMLFLLPNPMLPLVLQQQPSVLVRSTLVGQRVLAPTTLWLGEELIPILLHQLMESRPIMILVQALVILV